MLFMATNRKRHRRKEFGGEPMPHGGLTYLSGPDLSDRTPASFRRRLLEHLTPPAELAEGTFEVPRVVGFVHGFNVDWEGARRWAGLVDDRLTSKLQGPKATVGISWPSDGAPTRYLDDRHAAEESAPAVTRAIVDAFRLLERERCSAELCLIAHSMGAYVVACAARRAWKMRGRPASMPIFSEIILVAPDLDANALEAGRIGEALPIFARRLTIYTGRHDRALLISAVKRAGVTGARLGRHGPAKPGLLPPNVVSVDVSAWSKIDDASPHSAHFHEPVILRDMLAVLAGQDRSEIEGRHPLEGDGHLFEIPADG